MTPQPLLSIRGNELYVRSPLADRLQEEILKLGTSAEPSLMSVLLQAHTSIALNAVFDVDKKEALAFIKGIEDVVERARMLGYYMHAQANQKYGTEPYYYHLEMVHEMLVARFMGPLSAAQRIIARAAAYLHDVIEDAGLTYNDVVEVVGVEIAEIAYLLTNLRGRNRHERAPLEYYHGIAGNIIATAVKLADRYANMYNGFVSNKPSMLRKYFKEFPEFEGYLRCPAFEKELEQFRDDIVTWRIATIEKESAA